MVEIGVVDLFFVKIELKWRVFTGRLHQALVTPYACLNVVGVAVVSQYGGIPDVFVPILSHLCKGSFQREVDSRLGFKHLIGEGRTDKRQK